LRIAIVGVAIGRIAPLRLSSLEGPECARKLPFHCALVGLPPSHDVPKRRPAARVACAVAIAGRPLRHDAFHSRSLRLGEHAKT
jgi:hypothetical protein